ncbi:hypothetical protein OIU74_023243 [Salix koriyanagi]|uniref:Uncharacterized protein n=1 Tax=Salix koriyanagi TaxID=2511006 RepID=A0A9Q1AAV3_9ROSI|nr:hypothetical protein OIU74_023243 [Salix koriyanagi]
MARGWISIPHLQNIYALWDQFWYKVQVLSFLADLFSLVLCPDIWVKYNGLKKDLSVFTFSVVSWVQEAYIQGMLDRLNQGKFQSSRVSFYQN